MGNLTFLQDGRPFAVSSTRKEGVDLECLDLCDTDNPCVHGGRCVNHYTRTLCDCFGTGYEGHRCNRKGIDRSCCHFGIVIKYASSISQEELAEGYMYISIADRRGILSLLLSF